MGVSVGPELPCAVAGHRGEKGDPGLCGCSTDKQSLGVSEQCLISLREVQPAWAITHLDGQSEPGGLPTHSLCPSNYTALTRLLHCVPVMTPARRSLHLSRETGATAMPGLGRTGGSGDHGVGHGRET